MVQYVWCGLVWYGTSEQIVSRISAVKITPFGLDGYIRFSISRKKPYCRFEASRPLVLQWLQYSLIVCQHAMGVI